MWEILHCHEGQESKSIIQGIINRNIFKCILEGEVKVGAIWQNSDNNMAIFLFKK